MKLSVQDVHRIQTMLVDIWQAHIQSFTEDAQGATVQPPAPPPAPPAQPHLAAPQPQAQPAQAVPAERRGHVIQARPDGGLFCVKCGKQTQYTKHLRAKILNKVWRNKDLPQARWLTAPGRMQATSRLDDLQANLQDVLNTGVKLAMTMLCMTRHHECSLQECVNCPASRYYFWDPAGFIGLVLRFSGKRDGHMSKCGDVDRDGELNR
eukprot:s4832_g2.t1